MIGWLHISIPCLFLSLAGCWQDDSGLGSNPLGCTEIGCDDRLDVIFESQDAQTFPAGTYTFTLTPNGESPLVATCSFDRHQDLACSGDTHVLTVLAADREFSIRLLEAPATVTASLVFEQQRLGEKMLSPDYSMVTPNGPQCEPICFQATVAFEVICPEPTEGL